MSDGILKAQQFIERLRSSGFYVSNASVFGSWAKGSATDESDIDVCVISPNFGKDYIQEMVDLRKVSLSVDSRIEPIPFTPQDYADRLGSLASEIRKNSIKLK